MEARILDQVWQLMTTHGVMNCFQKVHDILQKDPTCQTADTWMFYLLKALKNIGLEKLPKEELKHYKANFEEVSAALSEPSSDTETQEKVYKYLSGLTNASSPIPETSSFTAKRPTTSTSSTTAPGVTTAADVGTWLPPWFTEINSDELNADPDLSAILGEGTGTF